MAFYERGIVTASAGAGAAYFDLRTNSTVRARIREIGLTIAAGTNSQVGLIRPATIGTASTTLTGVARDAADVAPVSVVGTAWSSAPTIAGTPLYLRQGMIGGTVGNGLVWTFPEQQGLVVPVSSSILVWNFGAAQGPVINGWLIWEE